VKRVASRAAACLPAAAAVAAAAVLLLLAGCADPPVRPIPVRHPIRADTDSLPSIALVTYAETVDPSRVSDGSFCPHADRSKFTLYFSVPEAILAEELEAAGYPITRISSRDASGFLQSYPAKVAVGFVGESRCETRVSLFGKRQAEDCSVRVKLSVTLPGQPPRGRLFDRIGEASLLEDIGTPDEEGPAPAWRDAVRDAIRQILSDPALASLLQNDSFSSSSLDPSQGRS
jgi:hypothetical protein